MGLSWNSWYNPLDNVASIAKTVNPYASVGGFATGGQQGAKSTSSPTYDQYRGEVNNSTGSTIPTTPDYGISMSDYNPNPTYSQFDSQGNRVGGSGGSGTSYDPNELAQYDSAISILQGNMGRLPSQSAIAYGNINKQYNTGVNELDTTAAQAEQSYNQQGVQNSQAFRGNKNVIADQASQGLRGLMRILGAYGAGGSSERGVAGQAVAGQASLQRSGANQTFSTNRRNLDTGYGNFKLQDANERKKLWDWKTSQGDQVSQQELTTRQDLLTKLADITGKRDQYRGGSYQGGAAPFITQAQALNSQIDNLGAINPTYDGTTPLYNPQSLDSYSASADQAQTGVNAQQQLNSPYLAMLLGQGQDDERLRVR